MVTRDQNNAFLHNLNHYEENQRIILRNSLLARHFSAKLRHFSDFLAFYGPLFCSRDEKLDIHIYLQPNLIESITIFTLLPQSKYFFSQNIENYRRKKTNRGKCLLRCYCIITVRDLLYVHQVLKGGSFWS